VADPFSEKLAALIGGPSGFAVASGSTSLVAAGSIAAGTLTLGLGSNVFASAGKQSGSVVVGFNTNGTGTSELGIAASGSQTVNLSGDVYRLAVGTLGSPTVTLAAVREGTVFASGTVSVLNIATVDGYSEKLNVSLGSTTGDATVASGTLNLLAAGSANSSTLLVSLGGTANAGAKTGTVLANYASDGTGTSGLSALASGSQTLTVTGNVYRLASGSLSAINLNLGNIRAGGAVGGSTIDISNVAANDGFSDLLGVLAGASIFRLARSFLTVAVKSWLTRDSVTPTVSPISLRLSSST